MIDIGKELLDKITKTFEESLKNSNRILRLEKQMPTATSYTVADAYAKEVGNLLAKAIRLHVSTDVLPDGRMYYNIADTILSDRLARNYELTAAAAEVVQKNLNEAFGVGLAAKKPKLNKNRIRDLIIRVSNSKDYNTVRDMLGVSVGNFTQAVITDCVEANMDFQAKTGMHPVLIRSTDGSCCEWCSEMAGVYKYPAPKEVYARHQSCTCTVTYYPEGATGRYMQNSYTKKFYSTADGKRLKREQVQALSMKPRR